MKEFNVVLRVKPSTFVNEQGETINYNQLFVVHEDGTSYAVKADKVGKVVVKMLMQKEK